MVSADTVVLGAGLNGLATAWQLGRYRAGKTLLVEQFSLGHSRGSSHGASRITRSTYPEAAYVHLMRVANHEDWPRLEKDSGTKLIHPRAGCFFGPPGGLWESWSETMGAFPDEAEILDPGSAVRLFPQFKFSGMAGVIHDRSAGIVAAGETLRTLAERCRVTGVDIREETRVETIEMESEPIRIRTSKGDIETGAVVVTAGPWASRLLPFLKSRLNPVRQHVGFFHRVDADPAGSPVWAYLGRGTDDFYYGIPPFGGMEAKAARHLTHGDGGGDDPDEEIPADPRTIDNLRAFLDRRFTAGAGRLVRAETCFYTNTATEDFVIDVHPKNPRVVIGAGFSGHGFKFGPLTGRILADLAVHGRSSVKEFVAHRDRFKVASQFS